MPEPPLNEKSIWALSHRERQILKLIVEGQTSGAVAYRAGLSARTAEGRSLRVPAKLDVQQTAELVRVAMSKKP